MECYFPIPKKSLICSFGSKLSYKIELFILTADNIWIKALRFDLKLLIFFVIYFGSCLYKKIISHYKKYLN